MRFTTDEIVHIACVLTSRGTTNTCERLAIKFAAEVKRRAPERYAELRKMGRIYEIDQD